MISLPYDFDTATIWHRIVQIALGVLALIAILAAVSLLVGKTVAALQLTLVLAIALFFAFKLRGIASFGATGTITATEVIARPVSVYGIPMRVPTGCFPIAEFRAIRLVRRLASSRAGPVTDIGDVYLVGRESARDIQVFSGAADKAKAAASDFCTLLHLEYVEGAPPGTTRIDLKLGA
jgi:hypothetical protein